MSGVRRILKEIRDFLIHLDREFEKGDWIMGTKEFIEKCQQLVAEYANSHLDVTDGAKKLMADEVYVVWSVKALQNSKALLSTPLPDGMYYEVTYNGDENEIYFDAYKKFENKKIQIWWKLWLVVYSLWCKCWRSTINMSRVRRILKEIRDFLIHLDREFEKGDKYE